ncbi:iki3 domain containing protein [Stylonychia lemnae]|uniref:Iki3 domain containing protein n=1 Tax=Stylonychia lemnae TaxID=5949 RepID=A0A078B1G6_STYLE|nr:iki3 domain containing protein [Stylonychia lemnae]|eukprot:CDW87182.1 iki3 domain containing protein [Stylonychia lemnae]
MENFLQEKLEQFNANVYNAYKANWGSLFDFIHDKNKDPARELKLIRKQDHNKSMRLTNNDQQFSFLKTNDYDSSHLQSLKKANNESRTAPISPKMYLTGKMKPSENKIHESFLHKIDQTFNSVNEGISQSTEVLSSKKVPKHFNISRTNNNNENIRNNTSPQFFAFQNIRRKIIISDKRPNRHPKNILEPARAEMDNSKISEINQIIRERLRSHQVSPLKSYLVDNSQIIEDIKTAAVSKIRPYITNFQTPFGNDIIGGMNKQRNMSNTDSVEEFTSAQNVRKSNHLQKAWKKTAETNQHTGQQTAKEKQMAQKRMNNREKTYGVKAQFTRMHNQLRRRVVFSKGDAEDNFKEIEIPKEFRDQLEKSKPKDKLQYLMNLNSELYINMKNTQKWMKIHNVDQSKYTQNQKNIEFAKELFKIWDEDESGNLEVDELTLPLIALGLSNDSSFVLKLLRSIDEEKFTKNKINAKITIRDFSKIFKKDYTSEKVIEVIKKTIKEQRAEVRRQAKKEIDQIEYQSILMDQSIKNNQSILGVENSKMQKNKRMSIVKSGELSKLSFLPSRDTRRTTAPTSNGLFSAGENGLVSGLSYVKEYGLQNEISMRDLQKSQQRGGRLLIGNQKLESAGTTERDKNEQMMLDVLSRQVEMSKYLNNNLQIQTKSKNTNYKSVAPPILEKHELLNEIEENDDNNEITLSDQLNIVRQWWQEIDKGRGNLSQTIEEVSRLLVNKRIAAEMETAKRIVGQSTKKSKTEIDWEDFNQIFCKGIFKEVLITLANKIKTSQNQVEKQGESLGGKLNEYQRKLLLEQLGHGMITDSHQAQGDNDRPVLYSLYQFKKKNGDTSVINETYKEFLKDPLGSIRKAEEERLKNHYVNDEFVKQIKLNPLDRESNAHQKKLIEAQKCLGDLDSQIQVHFQYVNNSTQNTTTQNTQQTSLSQQSRDGDQTARTQDSSTRKASQKQKQPDWNQIANDSVKLPKQYIQKTADERLKDQTDLLRKFQLILDQNSKNAYDL